MPDYAGQIFFVAKLAAGLLAIVDPLGVIPQFIALTENRPSSEIRSISLTTTIAVIVTLFLSSVCGERILTLFGISLPSFRTAGGILILLIAVYMFHAEPTLTKYRPEETREALTKSGIAIVPMAIPFLAGPGAITAVILYAHQCTTWGQWGILWAIILFVGLTVYLSLRLAEPIKNKIGQIGVNIISRLMGLILAAIAVEFITKGLAEIFPGWVSHGAR
jgi:multiple antibiotic resistance protein